MVSQEKRLIYSLTKEDVRRLRDVRLRLPNVSPPARFLQKFSLLLLLGMLILLVAEKYMFSVKAVRLSDAAGHPAAQALIKHFGELPRQIIVRRQLPDIRQLELVPQYKEGSYHEKDSIVLSDDDDAYAFFSKKLRDAFAANFSQAVVLPFSWVTLALILLFIFLYYFPSLNGLVGKTFAVVINDEGVDIQDGYGYEQYYPWSVCRYFVDRPTYLILVVSSDKTSKSFIPIPKRAIGEEKASMIQSFLQKRISRKYLVCYSIEKATCKLRVTIAAWRNKKMVPQKIMQFNDERLRSTGKK